MSITKSPISELQELCAKNKLPYPIYKVENGSYLHHHQPRFTVSCMIGGQHFLGFGCTKQEAKTAAAKVAYQHQPQPLSEHVVEHQPSSPYQPWDTHHDYCQLGKRVASFFDYINSNWLWEKNKLPCAVKMALAGFFFGNDGQRGDTVTCYKCGGKVSKWHRDDEPSLVHNKYFSSCPFFHDVSFYS